VQVSVLECLLLDGAPNVPAGAECVAFTIAATAEQVREIEQGYGRGAALTMSFGINADVQRLTTELNKLRTDLETEKSSWKRQTDILEAEIARYRAAYDKNPPEGASRAALLEVD